ncbi:phage tail tape measure protein [Palleronia caenipelagi]|uniref:Phage tail tape measure protein n=1 Tax=Palleronia caenipelagi TaxID=2489174 RepID=A0A547PW98_9RHOB|nr:phage tail tape measure protein [Palleronia caenipelagi]TRD18402.1 phage tail tape measure protein [Palleronia caenipelagi]
MAVGDLNIALVLKLVDKATGPAQAATTALRRIGRVSEETGRRGVVWTNEQIAANRARQGALMGEAFGVAALAGSLAAALRPAISFERSMAGVGAVARANDDELDRLTATARELGATTPWAASEAAEGMRFLAMAGFDTTQTIAAMPGMLNLASAGAIDLGRAADIASNVLSGFGLDAAQMTRLGDVLTNTFTSSNTDLAMLGETMKYVAPNAAALGVSLEQTAAMAGKLGDAGIQGSQAGTALRAMMLRLAALPKPAAEALDQLGVATMDATGNLRDMPTILAEVHTALQDLGTGSQAALINDIFGMEAASAATILLGEAGSGALQTYAEALTETGSAARVAAELNESTAGALKRLGSITESLAITMGTVLLPQIVSLLDRVIPVIGALERWAGAHPDLITLAFRLTAGLLALKLASIGLRFGLFALLGPVLQILRAGSGLLILLPRMAGALTALLNPLRLLKGAFIALRVALLATGIGALLAGIAMAGVWITNNWSGLGTFFANLWQSFRDGLGPAGPMIDRLVAGARKIGTWISGLTGPLEASAGQWQSWGQAAGTGLAGFVTMLGEIGGKIAGIFDPLMDKLRAVTDAFRVSLLDGVFRLIAEFNPFTLAVEGAQVLLSELGRVLGLPGEIIAAFGAIDLAETGHRMIRTLWDGANAVLGPMVAAIGAKLSGLVPGWMKSAWGWVSGDDGDATPRVAGGRDRGGPVRAGIPYLVGERAPEIFVPGTAGQILPARTLRAAMMAATLAAPATLPAAAAIAESAPARPLIDRRPALAAPTPAPPVIRHGDTITISITAAPGMDEATLARRIREELERREDARRADLHDGVDY